MVGNVNLLNIGESLHYLNRGKGRECHFREGAEVVVTSKRGTSEDRVTGRFIAVARKDLFTKILVHTFDKFGSKGPLVQKLL